MMEEIKEQEDFVIEGPLWIQVQALEKGLEIVVTEGKIDKPKRARLFSKDGEELTFPEDINDLLENHFSAIDDEEDYPIEEDDWYYSTLLRFEDFEHVIQLSHYVSLDEDRSDDILFSYEDKYYLM